MRELVQRYRPLVGMVVLCQVLGLSRATWYRQQATGAPSSLPRHRLPKSDQGPLAPLGEGTTTEHGGQGALVATAPPTALNEGASVATARKGTMGEEDIEKEVFSTLKQGEAASQTPSGTASNPRALSAAERQQVLAVLHEPRFIDKAPAELYATLLDEERYLCSERTMYRILQEHSEVRERRDQLRHPSYHAPQLLATKPNELWRWDITKLRGPTTWSYFYLYVILDVFSRYVVGWMVADQKLATLAQDFIAETYKRQEVVPGQLTLHADRGCSMTSKTVALLLSDLGVIKTHSRPHVSDDNPFSEAQFKTLKYRPDFPERFGAKEHARTHCQDFFAWYNNEHHHAGISMLTPHDVHYGLAQERLALRAKVLAAAHAAHPERFVHGVPHPQALPTTVWINKPKEEVPQSESARV